MVETGIMICIFQMEFNKINAALYHFIPSWDIVASRFCLQLVFTHTPPPSPQHWIIALMILKLISVAPSFLPDSARPGSAVM